MVHWKISIQYKRRVFAYIKYALYISLIVNGYLAILDESKPDLYNSEGWLLILLLLEWQSIRYLKHRFFYSLEKKLIFALQIFAYCAISWSMYGYVITQEWIDFAYELLWTIMSIFIWMDLNLSPKYWWQQENHSEILRNLLFLLLVIITAIWVWQEETTAVIESILWLLCFYVIETNSMQKYFRNKNEGDNHRPQTSV